MILSPTELTNLRLSLSSTPVQPETISLLPFMGVPLTVNPRYVFSRQNEFWREQGWQAISLPRSPHLCLDHKTVHPNAREWHRHNAVLLITHDHCHILRPTITSLPEKALASYSVRTVGDVARIYDVWANSDICPASIGKSTFETTSAILTTIRTYHRNDMSRIDLHAHAARLLQEHTQASLEDSATSGLLIVDALEGWVPGGG